MLMIVIHMDEGGSTGSAVNSLRRARRPEGVRYEIETCERWQIDGVRSGAAPGLDVFAAAKAVGFDDARLDVDEPDVRHAVARIELAFDASIGDGGARGECLDRQGGRTLDAPPARRGMSVVSEEDEVRLQDRRVREDHVDRREQEQTQVMCLDVAIEHPEEPSENDLVVERRCRRSAAEASSGKTFRDPSTRTGRPFSATWRPATERS